MKVIQGTGQVVNEPDWLSLFSDPLEVAQASERWRIITTELRDRGLLAAANAHSIERLILAQLLFDRASKEAAEHGSVVRPRRGSAKAIARINPVFKVMVDAGKAAVALEAELGLSPRTRGRVSKVERRQNVRRPADSYLKPISSDPTRDL